MPDKTLSVEEDRTLTQRAHDRIQVGWKLWFYNEPADKRHWFKVRAISRDRRFAICTRPANLQRTVLYCILDFAEGRRGPDDMVFGMGYETEEQIAERMAELEAGEIEVSHRRGVHLAIIDTFPKEHDW